MAKRLVYWLYQTYWSALDLMFPPNCGGCGTIGTRWCIDCHGNVQKVKPPICPLCGQCQTASEVCERCRMSPPRYTALRSWAIFDGCVRNALHRLKYRRDTALGEMLARPLITDLESFKWDVDVITPVPLGLARLVQRGYNQSALLARPLALALGVRYYPQSLRRSRETRSQVGLSAAQRKENVIGAFEARSDLVSGRNILVVDDVTTSGATLEACAVALFDAGALKVFGLTLARAVLKFPQV